MIIYPWEVIYDAIGSAALFGSFAIYSRWGPHPAIMMNLLRCPNLYQSPSQPRDATACKLRDMQSAADTGSHAHPRDLGTT